eukprot:gene6534-9982_t
MWCFVLGCVERLLGLRLCPPDHPSPIFVIFSLIMNGLCIIFAMTGITSDTNLPDNADEFGFDDSKPDTWLGVCLGICAVNILFAGYLYWKFSTMTKNRPGEQAVSGAAAMH